MLQEIFLERKSLWYARRVINQSIPNIKLLDKVEKQIIKMIIANEASALKDHYDITFHKTLAKVQVPEND